MAESTQSCVWCRRADPSTTSRNFTAISLLAHIQDMHPTVKIMSMKHRCPHEACLDVGSAIFNSASEVKEHLEKVHGGVGEWKGGEEKGEIGEVKIVWGYGWVRGPRSEFYVISSTIAQAAEKQRPGENGGSQIELVGQTKAWRPKSLPQYSFDAETLAIKAGDRAFRKPHYTQRCTVCPPDPKYVRMMYEALRRKIDAIEPRHKHTEDKDWVWET